MDSSEDLVGGPMAPATEGKADVDASSSPVELRSLSATVDKRPHGYDHNIIQIAAKALAAQIVKDWDQGGDAEEWAEDLAECPRYDGYDFAEALKDYCHVDPDAQLVDLLDSWGSYISSAERDAVHRWVLENPQTAAFEVGAQVIAKVGGEKKSGEISEINLRDATYIVWTPCCQSKKGHGGWIVPFEDVAPQSSTSPAPTMEGV